MKILTEILQTKIGEDRNEYIVKATLINVFNSSTGDYTHTYTSHGENISLVDAEDLAIKRVIKLSNKKYEN
ncbi:MAG: hypothetical protein WC055_15860 [Melioribacteraceae bacterium]